MKLNPDCIRDILFATQEHTDFSTNIMLGKDNYTQMTDKYSFEELIYHVDQCRNYGFIYADRRGSFYQIKDLTPAGHSFIANIEQENNWSKVKVAASKLGSIALPVLQALASDTIFSKIDKIING